MRSRAADGLHVQAAREHFGALTPLRAYRSPAQAIGEVSAGAATVAVLPLPSETEAPRDAWWTALLHKDEPRIHVVARLPFWRPRPEGAPTSQALVVAAVAPDASGADRSLLGLELPLEVSRARLTAALTAAGLEPGNVILRRDPGAPVADALAEVDGFVADDDPRLAALDAVLRRPVVLGAYAIPVGRNRRMTQRRARARKSCEISPYVGGESTLPGINRVDKLSSNEGAFGVPPGAQEAYRRLAGELHRYPDGGAPDLRRAIGARFGLDPARIVCGAGSDDLIYQLCLAYGGPGRDIVMTEHGFSIYQIAGTYAGSRVIKTRERNLTADVDAMLAAVSPATRLCFLANPNNPTGCMLPYEEVARLRAGLPPEVLLVLDAAYAEYVDRPDYDPGIRLVDATDNTVMTRTFSKIFGLGGMRIGWAYAPAAVIDVLNRVRAPFNVSIAAQAAAIAALAEPGWVEKGRAHNSRIPPEAGRRAARRRASRSGPARATSCWPISPPRRAPQAADAYLRRRGVIARPVGGYGLPHCLRITVGTAEEVQVVIDALTEFMATEHGGVGPHG